MIVIVIVIVFYRVLIVVSFSFCLSEEDVSLSLFQSKVFPSCPAHFY